MESSLGEKANSVRFVMQHFRLQKELLNKLTHDLIELLIFNEFVPKCIWGYCNDPKFSDR